MALFIFVDNLQKGGQMKWIIGQGAVSTCISIAGNFKSKCLKSFNEDFNQNFSHYRPWMSSPHFRRQERMWTMHEKSGILVSNYHYLSCLKSSIDEATIPVLALNDEEQVLKIFDNISEKRPTSFKVFNAALDMVSNHGGWIGQIYSSIVDEVIPVYGVRYVESSNSCTSHHFLGSPFHAIPIPLTMSPVFDLAVSFSHELGHQILSIYQRSDRIIKSDLLTPVYSGVRGTVRPAIQAFHAAVASAYMIESCRHVIKVLHGVERAYALEVLEEKYQEFLPTIESLENSVEFTELGEKMFEELLTVKLQNNNIRVET
jgi:hypothetical protein